MWDYDIAADLMNCDAQWYAIMGRPMTQPVCSIDDFRAIIHPDDVERATEVSATAAQLLTAGEDYSIIFRIVRPNGEIRWLRSAACVLEDASHRPVRAVGFVTDVTEAQLAEDLLKRNNARLIEENEALSRQALIDPLTGIANRRRLDAELARAVRHAHRHGECLAVALLDVDRFKAYNDYYGHAQGDVALKAVAEAAASAAWRPYDLAARYGGEEFVLVLPGMAQPEGVLIRAADNLAAMKIRHATSPVTPYLTVSMGCAVVQHPEALGPAGILARTDKALYEAKGKGRNQWVVERID